MAHHMKTLLKSATNGRDVRFGRWIHSTTTSHRIFSWNQMLVMTNINETIGSQLETTHKSQSLFNNKNLISMTEKGLYILMPLVVKAMDKLVDIINDEMLAIKAQKISMPSLVSKRLWDKSGRWSESREELFRLKDRQNTDLCLAPTHEEVVTHLISAAKHLTENHLPIYLYQISSKFRDELKAKHGLLRGREFVMKGEDEVFKCNSCDKAFNAELIATRQEVECMFCSSHDLTKFNAIEVGHTFLLGNRYSEKFDAKYTANETKAKNIYSMGCYGLGVSRILAASVEVLSENHSIRWPYALAPFKVCLVLPKKGSKEDVSNGTAFTQDFANCLSNVLNEDILVDDRINQTIGRRLAGLETLGIPYTIIGGKRITDEMPKFEVIDNQTKNNYLMTQLECIQFLESVL
ncbi:unnamed protein product [Oppiella nova]|uniref:proline--tRNA ligase n=1 Tax=Oppiella nova TaxID=334625 RepID=A0A7R9LF38_9ACAR|nr:unnamed protein product [Oppiella nova]CAG2163028.1 unnamed protein product [Oppiella nova]